MAGAELGLDIPPAQVRLRPKFEDGYAWRIEPASQHLFSKGLSKLSTGAYRELISRVGSSFRVVAAAAKTVSPNHMTGPKADSLQMHIEGLQEKLEVLEELCRARRPCPSCCRREASAL